MNIDRPCLSEHMRLQPMTADSVSRALQSTVKHIRLSQLHTLLTEERRGWYKLCFFHHDISRGSTEPDSLDKAPYYGDKYSPVCPPATLNPPTIMGVHGLSTQLLGNCRKTLSSSVAARVNSVLVSTQTLSCTEKAGELIYIEQYTHSHVFLSILW